MGGVETGAWNCTSAESTQPDGPIRHPAEVNVVARIAFSVREEVLVIVAVYAAPTRSLTSWSNRGRMYGPNEH